MAYVNQFQGFGGNPGYFNGVTPGAFGTAKPIFDPTLPNGDCLPRVTNAESASQYRMNPNSRVALFNETEDIFYIVTSDAGGYKTVQAFSFTPLVPEAPKEEPKYVTVEEFEKFKQEVLDGQQLIRRTTGTGICQPEWTRTDKGPT